ncbi:MAG: hypothetical protein CMM74_06880 [Rhodospirillaceae bacterium]|jgi:hypothetical protein|nr:hypothetical protein [Rhodospirillaceae bacterium]
MAGHFNPQAIESPVWKRKILNRPVAPQLHLRPTIGRPKIYAFKSRQVLLNAKRHADKTPSLRERIR